MKNHLLYSSFLCALAYISFSGAMHNQNIKTLKGEILSLSQKIDDSMNLFPFIMKNNNPQFLQSFKEVYLLKSKCKALENKMSILRQNKTSNKMDIYFRKNFNSPDATPSLSELEKLAVQYVEQETQDTQALESLYQNLSLRTDESLAYLNEKESTELTCIFKRLNKQ
jgi:hypothetical protein